MLNIFSLIIFTASGLIFFIQPLVAKILLPKFGGSATVWVCCVLFFQLALLLGYIYADMLRKLTSINQQIKSHLAIVALMILYSLTVYNYGYNHISQWSLFSVFNQSPYLKIIALLMVLLAPQVIILSSTSSLVQYWYSKTRLKHASNPYPLYSISSIANISGLVIYVLLMEPLVGNSNLYFFWYLILAIFCCCLAMGGYIILKNLNTALIKPGKTSELSFNKSQVIKWMIYSAVPASLMLSITQIITSRVVISPVFWVIPLVLYLLSFSLAFARRKFFSFKSLRYLPCFILPTLFFYPISVTFSISLAIVINLGLFFLISLFFHYLLYIQRPHTKDLTIFYIVIGIGGILGNFLNTFIAPTIFSDFYEYHLVMILTMFLLSGLNIKSEKMPKALGLLLLLLTPALIWTVQYSVLISFMMSAIVVAVIFCLYFHERKVLYVALSSFMLLSPIVFHNTGMILYAARNFYGRQEVYKSGSNHVLVSGEIMQGIQSLNDNQFAISYFKPVAQILQSFRNPIDIAVIGLGVGTISCLKKKVDTINFIEINPDMIHIANNQKLFSYTRKCGPVAVTLGDGRLELSKGNTGQYDIIILDAFQGGAIPVHLLTKEAIAVYLDKVKTSGLVLLNISNRFVDLRHVVGSIANNFGMSAYFLYNKGTQATEKSSRWLALFKQDSKSMENQQANIKFLKSLNPQWVKLENYRDTLWTDNYTNILSIMY